MNTAESHLLRLKSFATELEMEAELYEKQMAAERAYLRRAQAAVIDAYRDRVAALARRIVPAQYWAEGEQVGLIGVLIAVGKYDPGTSTAFDDLALQEARREIEMWMGRGVYWRPVMNTDLLPDAEVKARLVVFLATLSEGERRLLLSVPLREPRRRS